MKSRPTARLLLILAIVVAAACDKVPLLAPTQSTITLSISSTTLLPGQSAQVVATVTEQAGTTVHNGTLVTFTGSLGTFNPTEAVTQNGKATTTFLSNGQTGTMKIGAVSGSAKAEVEVKIAGPVVGNVVLRAEPSNVPVTGGTVQLIAIVTEEGGFPLGGAPVVFSTDNGQLDANTVFSDANGEARTRLTTNIDSNVKARVGTKEGTLVVRAINNPTASISVSPTSPIAGLPLTITVTPGSTTGGRPIQNVILDLGDGTQRSLGAISGATPVFHTYQRADTYTLTVTIIDIGGQRTSSSATIVVQRAVVNVSFTNPPSSGQVGTQLNFTVAVTNSSNLPITGIVVSFGDGRSATLPGNGGTAGHTYTVANTYTVTATATDQTGGTYSSSIQVIIAPPTAFEVTLDAQSAEAASPMTCVPATGYPKRCNILFIGGGVAVKFTANATPGFGATITSYRWAYGDGSGETTTAREVDHVFRSRGEFVTVVTVFASNGATGTQRITILVE